MMYVEGLGLIDDIFSLRPFHRLSFEKDIAGSFRCDDSRSVLPVSYFGPGETLDLKSPENRLPLPNLELRFSFSVDLRLVSTSYLPGPGTSREDFELLGLVDRSLFLTRLVAD